MTTSFGSNKCSKCGMEYNVTMQGHKCICDIKTIGKNYSCNNTGKRHKSDFYQTPYSITEQLLEHEKFDYNRSILEPACGDGAIVKIIKKYWDEEYSCWYDKNTHRSFFGDDFLTSNSKSDYIITTPPFSISFDFINKCKKVAKIKFALLLPLSYLHGQKRYENKIFSDPDYPLTKIYVFTRYPLLEETIREDGKYKTGMMVYGWFIWENKKHIEVFSNNYDRLKYGYPVIKWIDNNKYVLNKNDK
jgi:hypothetical protein